MRSTQPAAPGRTLAGERWREAQWPLIALAAAATLALGALGFDRYLRALGDTRAPADLLYLALQLFALESGALRGPLPWQLEVARFLAPALTVYTAVQALAVVFRRQLEALRARRMRGHVVVCGLGRKGRLLARSFRAAGELVVAIERDSDGAGVAPCRDAGVLVLAGDATDSSTLRRAGVGRARQLVAVCGDDGANAAIAVAARALATERDRRPLVAVAHVVDPELCALLRERELMHGARDRFRLEFFNVFEAGAAAMLDEVPWRADPSPHLALVGCGHFGQALLRQVARCRLPAGPSAPRVTVIDHDGERLAHARALLGAAGPWRLETLALDVRSPDFAAARWALDAGGRPTVSAVYVCLDGDGTALGAALALHRRLAGWEIPIVVRTEEESGLATLLHRGGAADDLYRDLRGFGVLERTCRPERLLAVSRETLAQAIHTHYLEHRRTAGDTTAEDPALVPWTHLPEELRESNRAQADDLGRKLAAIGCEITRAAIDDREPFALSVEEIERLAELEHRRWVDERVGDGWTLAPGPKDVARRTSPNLVPWPALDEATREIDRQAVRATPALLAAIGFAVRRRDPTKR